MVLVVLRRSCHGVGTTWGSLNLGTCSQPQELETRGAFSIGFDESLRSFKMLEMSKLSLQVLNQGLQTQHT